MCFKLPQSKILAIIGDRLKNFFEDLFFGKHLRLCPWSLALASNISVLDLERVCPRKGCPWPWPRIFFVSLALASSLVSSTPPLLFMVTLLARMAVISKDGTPQFLLRSTVHWYGTPFLQRFWYGTLVHNLNLPTKRVMCDRARRAQSLGYSLVIIVAS